jgi:hypothetical protein
MPTARRFYLPDGEAIAGTTKAMLPTRLATVSKARTQHGLRHNLSSFLSHPRPQQGQRPRHVHGAWDKAMGTRLEAQEACAWAPKATYGLDAVPGGGGNSVSSNNEGANLKQRGPAAAANSPSTPPSTNPHHENTLSVLVGNHGKCLFTSFDDITVFSPFCGGLCVLPWRRHCPPRVPTAWGSSAHHTS